MAIQAVRDVLVNASAVTALVPANQISALIRPQSIAPPAVTLSRISSVPVNHLNGAPTLTGNEVQLDVWASTYDGARAIADACRTALVAADLVMTFELDGYEPETDPELYRVTQQWSVWT